MSRADLIPNLYHQRHDLSAAERGVLTAALLTGIERDGLLTARGGVTSHAAVVAHRLAKTCVVGCASLICDEQARECRFGRTTLQAGDFISIDGQAGAVYEGRIRSLLI